VLFEKGMDFEIRDVDLFNKPEDISVMNPYGQVPILVERDLILYESNIINEYIDERFPHPQLMPADPLMRARARLMLFNFEKELFVHVHTLENDKSKGAEKAHEKARAEIRDRLTTLAPLFIKNKYMLGDEFSMLDVAVALASGPLRHRTIEDGCASDEICGTDFLPSCIHRSTDAVRKGHASLRRAGCRRNMAGTALPKDRKPCLKSRPSPTCCVPFTNGARTTATRPISPPPSIPARLCRASS
jgi:RNA polymerase-associated protein